MLLVGLPAAGEALAGMALKSWRAREPTAPVDSRVPREAQRRYGG
jgi:hypothetical protein